MLDPHLGSICVHISTIFKSENLKVFFFLKFRSAHVNDVCALYHIHYSI